MKAEGGKDDKWDVPSIVEVPKDRIDMISALSGGAGDRNANKNNT